MYYTTHNPKGEIVFFRTVDDFIKWINKNHTVIQDEYDNGFYMREIDTLVQSSKKSNDELLKRWDMLEDLLDSMLAMIDDSDGVMGLHLNGELAEWEELTNGKFNDWLWTLNELNINHQKKG